MILRSVGVVGEDFTERSVVVHLAEVVEEKNAIPMVNVRNRPEEK